MAVQGRQERSYYANILCNTCYAPEIKKLEEVKSGACTYVHTCVGSSYVSVTLTMTYID